MIDLISRKRPIIEIYSLDSRAFFTHYSLGLLCVQRKLETILPKRIIRVGGPRSVLESLVVGAKQSGWKVRLNPRINRNAAIVINLSRVDKIRTLSLKLEKGRIQNLILGPNIDLKSEPNNLIIKRSKYDLTLVPSEWTRNIFQKWESSSHLKMEIWAAGVDAKFWQPKKKQIKKSILIYSKGEVENEFINYIKENYQLNHRIELMFYGSHSRRDYLRELDRASVLIWLGTTETQGMALCESWAMDVPSIVLSRPVRKILNSHWPSSSAPYLTKSTGRFFSTTHELKSSIDEALHGKFHPRQWVIENQTAQISFRNLVTVVEKLRSKDTE